MTTIEERMTILETEFRTELKHLATKADLKDLETRLTTDIKELETRLTADMKDLETRLMLRLGGLMVAGFGAVIAALRLWL